MGVTTSERAGVSAAKYLEQDTLLNRINLLKRRPRLEERCHPKLPSNPRTKAVCGLSLMSVLSLVQEIFLRVVQCSPFLKTNVSKFQFYQESGRRKTTEWMSYRLKSILFIYLMYSFYSCTYPSFTFLFISVPRVPRSNDLSVSSNQPLSFSIFLMLLFHELTFFSFSPMTAVAR